MTDINIQIQANDWAKPLMDDSLNGYRYICLAGGRSGGKDVALTQMMIIRSMMRPSYQTIVAREFQNSLKDSNKANVESILRNDFAAVLPYWDLQESVTKFTHPSSGAVSEISYRGIARNIDSWRSVDADLVVVNESHNISQESLDILRPSIRRPGSQIAFALNPRYPFDPVAQMMLETPSDDVYIIRTNYDCNKFHPPEMEVERRRDERHNPKYAHIWDGEYDYSGLGGLFAVNNLVEGRIDGGRAVRAWDIASTKAGGDYTAGVRLRYKDGYYCIEDLIRFQGDAGEVVNRIAVTHRQEPDTMVVVEEMPASGHFLIEYLKRQGVPVRGSRARGQKDVRARAVAAAVGSGLVMMAKADWNDILRNELVQFPNGAHDDITDALAHAFNSIRAVDASRILAVV